MSVFARLLLPDGNLVEVTPGSVIGRHATVAARVNEPSVSEAHAFVSLRGDALMALALRGRLAVGGVRANEIELKAGLIIQLAPGVDIAVVSVSLPYSVLALEADGMARQVLPHLLSICGEELVVGFVPGADAIIWSDGELHRLRRAGEPDRELEVGDTISIGARLMRIVDVPLREVGAAATVPHEGARRRPLLIVLRYDTVHIHAGDDPVVIDGLAARLLSELALMRGPIEWETLARGLWPDEPISPSVRGRWDQMLNRLRRRLRDAGLPADLVRADGHGRVEVVLGPRDEVRDEG